MATDSHETTRLGPRPFDDSFELARACRDLLHEIVLRTLRSAGTPLQDESDASEIVAAVVEREFADSPSESLDGVRDFAQIMNACRAVLAEALGDAPAEFSAAAIDQRAPVKVKLAVADGVEPDGSTTARTLIRWLEGFQKAMQDGHPLAAHVVQLRLEHYHDREIARTLGLGTRLVRRIRRDTQQASALAGDKE